MTKKETSVDPVILARCYGLYARVVTGATKYLRDEADTTSPMMERLRHDKCRAENVINAFLAVQRFLGLHQMADRLFDYCDRLLFLAQLQELFTSRGRPHSELQHTHDPQVDNQAAAWYTALASSVFYEALDEAMTIAQLHNTIDAVAKTIWNDGALPAMGVIDFKPDLKYEEIQPEMLAFFQQQYDATKKTVH